MIVVTGGAGFIGSNIVAALCEAGHDVVVADRFGNDDRWKNVAKRDLADIVDPDGLHFYLRDAGRRLSAVIHMGAISATTERDVDLILDVNYRLSRDIWEACAAARTPLVYASSAATYGDGAAGFDDDPARLPALAPLNPYGWSKHLFDRWAVRQAARGAPSPPFWAGLKFFNVYGPNEHHKGAMKSVVAQIAPKAAAGETVTLFRSHNPKYPDGGQLRDFVYVKDCVDVVLWLLAKAPASGIYNLGTGQARSFLDLARATFAALNRAPQIAFADTPPEIRDRYQYFTQARMERLRAAGYERPFTALEDGVADYVRNYLTAPDPYR